MANPKGGRPRGLLDYTQGTSPYGGLLSQIFKQYPALAAHASDYAVIQGRPMTQGDDRQLESYPPDESWNPLPGKATTEVYNQDPTQQQNLITGDMLHHLANVDPRWAAMKSDVAPPQMSAPRQDEYLMGYLTPDAQNDWASQYTPEQKLKLENMRAYLMRSRGSGGAR